MTASLSSGSPAAGTIFAARRAAWRELPIAAKAGKHLRTTALRVRSMSEHLRSAEIGSVDSEVTPLLTSMPFAQDVHPAPDMAIVVICVGASPEVVGAVRSIVDLETPCEVIVVNSGGGDIGRRLGPLSE